MYSSYRKVFDHHLKFGDKPALLLVDFMKAYTDPNSSLFSQYVVEAAKCSKYLVEQVRSYQIPVIHTRVMYQDHSLDGGLFVEKIPTLKKMTQDNHLTHFTEAVTPKPEDIVINKQYASCFFSTPLASILQSLRVDTLIIAGCSTSGCIRATTVDAVQHGFRPFVVEECVGDRELGPHEASLFDIQSKYGEVVSYDALADLLNKE